MATQRPSTPFQRDFILNLSVDLGLSTRTALFGYISTTLDRTVTTWDDVSLADASAVIDRMRDDTDQHEY